MSASKQKNQKSKQPGQQQQQQQEGGTPKVPCSKRMGTNAAAEVRTPHSKKQKKGTAKAEQAQLPPAGKQQQQDSVKKHELGTPKAHPQAADAALRTPQHSKIKSSKKHKLLKTAPR